MKRNDKCTRIRYESNFRSISDLIDDRLEGFKKWHSAETSSQKGCDNYFPVSGTFLAVCPFGKQLNHLPRILEQFRVRQPETDAYWSLYGTHAFAASAAAADEAGKSPSSSTVVLRPGVEHALILMIDQHQIFDSERKHVCGFGWWNAGTTKVLKMVPFRSQDYPEPSEYWSRTETDAIRFGERFVTPSDDGWNLTFSNVSYAWEIERVHSKWFETAHANFVATNTLTTSGLPGIEFVGNVTLSCLDMEVMFQHALALADRSACVEAVASILDQYTDPNFYHAAIKHFTEHGDYSATFFFVRHAIDRLRYRNCDDRQVKIVSLKAFVHFVRAASDAKYRHLARKLIEEAAEEEIIDVYSLAINFGSYDMVALINELRDIAINPAKLEAIVTTATDNFLVAQQQKSVRVSARFDIFINVVSGRLSSETIVLKSAISGAIQLTSLIRSFSV
jgi:hypothetical protein